MASETTAHVAGPTWLLRTHCCCTALLTLGSAYIAYRHDRAFALRFGADETTALLWPLIVDGLLMMAAIELWKTSYHPGTAGGQWKAWLSFTLGIALSSLNFGAVPSQSL